MFQKRGVNANKPVLSSGELYYATDNQQLSCGPTPVTFAPTVGTAIQLSKSAAITATTIYAVPASSGGLYRINWLAKITTAATTSSTLGGLTITYTENTDSTAASVVAQGINSAGAAVTTLTTNSITSTGIMSGILIVSAKASTNIQYAFAYASTGGTAMVYKLHIKVDCL